MKILSPAFILPFLLLFTVAVRAADAPRFPFLTPWDDTISSFVDVSSLNDGPAGAHGFIVIKDGHFIEGDTGRRIRFFGTNLAFEGVFPSHEDAEKLAAHFTKYGINVVRLHHYDNTFNWVPPGGKIWDPKYPDHRHIDPGQLDKMDYLVSQLEKRGIYIDMCLHVSRKFSPADGFPDAVSKLPPASDKWASYDKRVDEFDPQMITVDKEYARDLLTHVNPYTGKSYAVDPGLLNVEINNENSLMDLYGGTPGNYLTGWPDPYGKELADLWNAWLIKKYGTTQKMAAAWNVAGETANPNLYHQSLEAGTIRVEPLHQMKKTEHADWLAFLADTETAYVTTMRTYLRNDLGVKQPIFCSQIGFGGLWSNYRESTSDYVDHHAYWEIHNTLKDPIQNQPMVRSLGINDPLTRIAFERNAGQPTSVTEFNDCFPNEYRAEALPDYASFASFQDWDAIFLFVYEGYGALGARTGSNDRIMGAYETSVDPAIWGFMPSAALIFRGNLVPVAPSVQTLGLPAQFPAAQVAAGLTGAKAWTKAGVSTAAPFTYRVQLGIGLPDDLSNSAQPASAIQVQTTDPQTARYVVDAPNAKVVSGFVGGQTISLTGATIAFGNLTNGFGALTLVPMDGKTLAQSSRILLTMVTHTQNKGQTWNEARTQLVNVGNAPPQVDDAAANITITTDGPRTVFTLNATGGRQDAVSSTYKDGQLSFAITPSQTSIWFAITKP